MSNPIEEAKAHFMASSTLTEADVAKYAMSGKNFYGMMNFENLEKSIEPENWIFASKVLNQTNNTTAAATTTTSSAVQKDV